MAKKEVKSVNGLNATAIANGNEDVKTIYDFKKDTELFLNELANNRKGYEFEISDMDYSKFPIYHITDVKHYDDKDGDAPRLINECASFHIKECPGWLFGIWFHYIGEEETENEDWQNDERTGYFYAKYEKEIDDYNLFDVSEARLKVEFRLDRDRYCSEYIPTHIIGFSLKLVEFIRKNKNLAFVRDLCFNDYIEGYDFNIEYISKLKARKLVKKYYKNKKLEKKYNKILNQKMIKAIKHIASTMGFKDFYVEEDEYCKMQKLDPEYLVCAPLSTNKEIAKKLKDYSNGRGLFYFDKDGNKYYFKIEDKCNKIARRHDVYWYNGVNRYFYVDKEK